MVLLSWGSFSGTDAQMQANLEDLQAGRDGQPGTDDDVAVFMYMSIGEEGSGIPKTLDGGVYHGDRKGPTTFEQGDSRHMHQGVADFYLSEHGNCTLWVNGDWGTYYVDPRSPDWQALTLDEANHWLNDFGFDGIFFDTVGDADPWYGRGFVAEGGYQLAKAFKENFPSSLLMWNGAPFYFSPHYSFHYSFNPVQYADVIMFESYYHSWYPTYAVATSPYEASWPVNQNFWMPKIMAEASRTDNFAIVIELDYWEDPSKAPESEDWHEYMTILQTYGMLPSITNKSVQLSSNVAYENLPKDVAAPQWFSSANGYLERCDASALYFMSKGKPDNANPSSRPGVQQVVSEAPGAITVEFDLAVDQTRPVLFNAYLAKSGSSLDYNARAVNANQATTYPVSSHQGKALTRGHTLVLADIGTTMPPNYEGKGYHCQGRRWLSDEPIYPFQFKLEGLEPGTYDITVRAEDSTSDVKVPETGRRGHSGGIEETNIVKLTVTVE
eukprot:Clim_evm35s198 gene=Clim_evmTU35s198